MEQKIADIALNHFKSGYNCAESVLLAFMETFDIKCKMAPRMASGFGGGISRTDHICGAFSGAVIALGLLSGRDKPDEDREKIYSKVSELEKRFSEEFGTIECTDLLGFDISTHEGHTAAKEAGVFQTKCSVFVQRSAEIISDIASRSTDN